MNDPVPHALLSPSSAYRFFPCPGSVRLSIDIPRSSSRYASEGTAAHQLGAWCLENGTEAYARLGDTIVADEVEFVVDEGMCDAVQVYLNTANRYADHGYALQVEERLDLSHLWAGQFGTADIVGYHEARKALVVIDYKHGAGVPVTVIENPQLLSYLSGAYRRYHERGVDSLTVVVVQPRAGGAAVREWEPSIGRLEEFEREFKIAAKRAMSPNAPLVAGQWCRFCPASAICPELRKHMLHTALVEFDLAAVPPAVEKIASLPKVAELTTAQLGNILDNADLFEEFIAAVKTEGLRRARLGELPLGWKVVEKRTLRRWKDEDKVFAMLTRIYGLAEEAVAKRKLVSPAQVEKLLGKSVAGGLNRMVVKPHGDPTLAPESDPRAAIPVDAAREFGQDLLRENLRASAAEKADDQ